jgi:hypothetical protein
MKKQIRRMSEKEAVEYVNSHLAEIDPYGVEMFAIRGDNYLPALRFRPSHVWDDGNKLPETLPGVCALWFVTRDIYGEWGDVVEIPSTKEYGRYRFLLRGRRHDMDGTENDQREIILSSHEIIAIVEYDDTPESK